MPDIDEYIKKCFELLGRCLNIGMGHIYLTWKELEAFTNKSCYDLNGWESEQIIMMSRNYCNFLQKAKDPNCSSPYSEHSDDFDEVEDMRERVDSTWDSIARSLNVK